MRVSVSAFVASLLATTPALAQDELVKRGPPPAWATASALMPVPDDAAGMVFVRRQDVVIHLDADGQAQYFGYRMKILHPNALQLGNVSLAWSPASGAPTVHAIKLHRGNETIDVLATSKFEILRREDQLEAASLDGILTAVLRVADLRVGDELEVALTRRMNDPTLGNRTAGVMPLGASPPSGRYRLRLSWDQGQKPGIRITPDIAAQVQSGERAVELRSDNPALLIPPKDAPPRFQWQRIIEYSDFTEWPAISRHFFPLYHSARQLPATSPLRQEAARIAAATSDPLARAQAALKLVQQDVRYVYVGLGGGNLTPATADETWRRRYGDCKGKTALLLALLAELGVEGEPVLVNSSGGDDGMDARLPNPGMFDHILVRARIGRTAYWLDGTLPPVVPPGETPIVRYRWMLPLSATGSALQPVKWPPARQPDELWTYDIDARAGFDAPAEVTTTTVFRGIKGLEQQAQMSSLTPAQMLSSLRQAMVGEQWQSVDAVKWRYDQTTQASILAITGTWAMDWDDDGGGARSMALPGGGFSPPDRRGRSAEQDQTLPYYNAPDFSCHVTTVRLPSATKPEHWSHKPGYDMRYFGRNYYRAFDLRDGSVRMVRGSRVELTEIDAAAASKDNGRIAAFDNSMAWINYDPAGKATAKPSTVRVPAADEIDWASDAAPCLAASTPR